MAFYGCEFSFNDIPSSQYGLMLYDIGGVVEDGTFSSGLEIVEDRTARRYKPLFYGVKQNTPLTFTMTFGVHPEDIDRGRSLDRYDMAVVAAWLTGQDGYRYLEIAQPDMEAMRYRCIITELSYVTWGQIPWAFRCTVTCDSPFAYLRPEEYEITPTAASFGNAPILTIWSKSPVIYYPRFELAYTPNSNDNATYRNNIKVRNLAEANSTDRTFFLDNLMITQNVVIDNENQVITSDEGINLYDSLEGMRFFRLLPGRNDIKVTGGSRSLLKIICEFPINIGG